MEEQRYPNIEDMPTGPGNTSWVYKLDGDHTFAPGQMVEVKIKGIRKNELSCAIVGGAHFDAMNSGLMLASGAWIGDRWPVFVNVGMMGPITLKDGTNVISARILRADKF